MSYEQKEGQGSLFRNKRKDSDKHPDYNGSIKINGVEHWLSGWVKEAKSGEQYMSLSLGKPKGGVGVPAEKQELLTPTPQQGSSLDPNDPIPF